MMKKTYLIIAATALVALSACTKNEVRSISDEPSQITWQTVIGPKSTKALVDGNTFDQKYKFKTYAFYNDNKSTWPTGASLYIDNAEVKYYDATVEGKPFVANSWHADQVYYWPKGGSLTFISYTIVNGDENNKATSYPANVSCDATDGLKVTGYDVDADANKNLDFMVAYATGQTANTTSSAKNEKGVPTAFKHALTQIVGFNVTTKEDYKKEDNGVVKAGSYVIKIKEIKIVNPYNKGDYSLKNDDTGAWNSTQYTNAKGKYAYKTSGGNTAELNKTTAVNLVNDQKAFLPQTFTAPAYTFTGTTEAEKAIEKRSTAYINAVMAVPHIELSYTTEYYREDNKVAFSDAATEYVPLSDTNKEGWGINKKITYNVTISLAGAQNELIIYWDPKVTDWETETGTITI